MGGEVLAGCCCCKAGTQAGTQAGAKAGSKAGTKAGTKAGAKAGAGGVGGLEMHEVVATGNTVEL